MGGSVAAGGDEPGVVRCSASLGRDGDGILYLDGVKRPRSVEEQQHPVDVVVAWTGGFADATRRTDGDGIVLRFPVAPAGLGSRLTGYVAMGGDGVLHIVREQPTRLEDGSVHRLPVWWAVDTGRPGAVDADARVIDFGIPYIDEMTNASLMARGRFSAADYAGPLFLARGQRLLLAGVNFADGPGPRRVLVGDAAAHVEAWADDVVVVRVPESAPVGETMVRVAVGPVFSDPETMEVKTEDVAGWFQIGSPGMRAALHGHPGIVGYNAHIAIVGVTEAGESFSRAETMAVPGLYATRLPNGAYEASFAAAYVVSDVRFGPNNEYVGSSHTPVIVPEQSFAFQIDDDEPIVLWMPQMLGH